MASWKARNNLRIGEAVFVLTLEIRVELPVLRGRIACIERHVDMTTRMADEVLAEQSILIVWEDV